MGRKYTLVQSWFFWLGTHFWVCITFCRVRYNVRLIIIIIIIIQAKMMLKYFYIGRNYLSNPWLILKRDIKMIRSWKFIQTYIYIYIFKWALAFVLYWLIFSCVAFRMIPYPLERGLMFYAYPTSTESTDRDLLPRMWICQYFFLV